MKVKKLFLIPLCTLLLCGCNRVDIQYYNSSTSQPSQNNTNIVEDFTNDSGVTYIENVSQTTLQTLYQKCKKATVTIETYITYAKQGVGTSTILYSSGSGFIAKESKNYLYIYTNAHVTNVSGSGIESIETEVILSDYSRYSATIIATDSSEDVAIVRINKPTSNNYLIASMADSSLVTPGQEVFAIGSPLGLDYALTITDGIISGVNVSSETDNDSDGNITTMYLLQTNVAINPGNSGGPLFNYKGEVVGVNTLKILQSSSGDDIEGIGFAIPMNHFEIVASTLEKNEKYTRPTIGISVAAISKMSLMYRQQLGITYQYGLYVDDVTNSNSGLKKNTIISHINNKQVYTFSDFASELYNYKKGDTVKVTYCNLDGSNSITIDVELI